jgi:ABC-2 type transport system permease protein
VKSAFATERRKLVAQLSTRIIAMILIVGPFLFAAVLSFQSGVPGDTLLGVWVHSSGFAVSLVVLSFAGQWGFPIVAGILAGDMFASEDRYGTWKMILTRSRSRRELFTGKVLAAFSASLVLLVLAWIASLIAGFVFTGAQSLVGLDGKLLSTGNLLVFVSIAWLVSALPLLAFTSIGVLFSVTTRNGIIGVLGPVLVALAMQLLALVGKGSIVHVLLVGAAFDDWHGLLESHRFYGPLLLESLVSVVWIVACLGISWRVLRSRDFAGTPVPRRPGWANAAGVVAVAAAVLALLGVATNWGPVTVTQKRLQRSFTAAFNSLTVLQQTELGRQVPSGAHLNVLPLCRRRTGSNVGPGEDWSCTLTVLIPQAGANPFNPTPVTYDMSVKSNGCYKAEAPPSFVGNQLMRAASGKQVTNPLYTIYGCFDTG